MRLINRKAVTKVAIGGVLLKKLLLKISKIHSKTPVSEPLFVKNRDSDTVFSYMNFAKNFKNTFSTEHFRMTTSECFS